jgi:hypothetical protein
MVNAYRVHITPTRPHGDAYCTAACCRDPHVPETVSHAMLDCPAISQAADWLRQLWAAVTGGDPPPRDPQVILADDHRVWAPAGAELHDLWTRLRLATLQAVWRVRCHRHLYARGGGQGSDLSHAAVLQAIQDIRFAIRRDWMRVEKGRAGILAESGLPSSWFRGRDPALKQDEFLALWGHRNVLCRVEATADQPCKLVVLIHPTWPTVATPGAIVVSGHGRASPSAGSSPP